MPSCTDCGQPVRGAYARCYRCHRRRQRMRWHDPERLPGQSARDAELGRSAFFVYVLETDYGHYVGHTGNLRGRLAAHKSDKVPSTAGGNPELLWVSGRLSTRDDAARFEAALKSMRDREMARYQEITGYAPQEYIGVSAQRSTQQRRNRHLARNKGCLSLVVGIVVVAAPAVYLLWQLAT